MAKRLDVNDLAGNADVILAVTTKKADVSSNLLNAIEEFNKHNGNLIKPIGQPVKYCSGGFLMPRGDSDLKTMIDSAITELNTDDRLKKIYTKYAPDDGKHWKIPALPYRE